MTWCVAQLNSSALAIPSLMERGIESYYPLLEGKPLISGYAFIRVEPDDAYTVERASHTRGVSHLLPIGTEKPVALPAGTVEKIKKRMGSGDYACDSTGLPVYRFHRQDKVVITSGPLEGFKGNFVQVTHGKVIVLIDLLGRAAKVSLHGHQIAPAE